MKSLYPQHKVARRTMKARCIDSDGCRSIRRQDGHEYPFYSFDNRSSDIIGFLCWACDLVGVHYTRPKATTVSIARRADVAFLDQVLERKT
jgi:hypothetical protein